MKQLKNVATLDALDELFADVAIELPVTRNLAGASDVLAAPVGIGGDNRPALTAPNRLAMLPMEGWDATHDGHPTDLIRRRWARFGESGAGLVWGEACAVRPDGRANPHQLTITPDTGGGLAELRSLLDDDQVAGIQLTHSGRWSKFSDTPSPRTAYRHPLLDEKVGAGAEHVLSDGELESIAEAYIAAAHVAAEAGFDFVDVKACHGYLLHEVLTGYDRPGQYGGDLEGRSRLMLGIIGEIRSQLPQLAIGVRLSIFDVVPHVPGPGGVGVPAVEGEYRYAFGGDGTGVGIDLGETHSLLTSLTDLGVSLVSTTAGSPYYCPHVQRPAFFPPSDGYKPPEDPLVGVARQIHATAEVTRRHPSLTVVGSGYSYLQEWLGPVAHAVVDDGWATMIGLGRMALSYPDLPRALLDGSELERRLICRTFSDCTTAPRAGLVSGCYPLDDFYKERPERVELSAAKKRTRERLR